MPRVIMPGLSTASAANNAGDFTSCRYQQDAAVDESLLLLLQRQNAWDERNIRQHLHDFINIEAVMEYVVLPVLGQQQQQQQQQQEGQQQQHQGSNKVSATTVEASLQCSSYCCCCPAEAGTRNSRSAFSILSELQTPFHATCTRKLFDSLQQQQQQQQQQGQQQQHCGNRSTRIHAGSACQEVFH